jgi:hypothetical protein
MTTLATTAAIEAYLDARNSMTESRAHTLVLGDTVATAADHLVHDYNDLQCDVEDSQGRECPEPIAHELQNGPLLELVRQEHDQYHDVPYAICGHRTCRQAVWLGQR